jgi:hypothetical protein
MNDYLLLILALPPAILSFIHLIKVIKFRGFYRYKNKEDGDLENNHKRIDQELKLTEIRHSKNSLILYLLYIVLIIIVALNIVNARSEKRFKGYELIKLLTRQLNSRLLNSIGNFRMFEIFHYSSW